MMLNQHRSLRTECESPVSPIAQRFLTAAIVLITTILALPLGGELHAQDAASQVTPQDLSVRIEQLETQVQNLQQDHRIILPVTALPLTSKASTQSSSSLMTNPWLMLCTMEVFLMTLPGLAIFYGGMMRKKNTLSIIAQCLACMGVASVLWFLVGYTFVFGEGGSSWIGSLRHACFWNVSSLPDARYGDTFSENLFAMYQLAFAVITPSLILGAIAERTRFISILMVVIAWTLIVYYPLAHMIWGDNGLLNGLRNPQALVLAIDFAGGAVVHMSSGWSALVLCIAIGPRKSFGRTPMPPHSMVLVAIGTGMLWIGWYGLNAGSALGDMSIAALAFTNTIFISTVSSLVWPLIEYARRRRPSILGFCSGAISGLVVSTPCCGFISTQAAFVVGLLAAVIPYYFCIHVKRYFRYDDTSDTFGIHAIGGTLGMVITGLAASSAANPSLLGPVPSVNGLKDAIAHHLLWLEQLKAIIAVISWSILGTLIVTGLVRLVTGLRATSNVEDQGLDITEHGESAYDF